jgi:hypothetical protein
MRYFYTFWHRARTVTFGPYANADEAMHAFQRSYGYWPEAPVRVQRYSP